MKNTKKQGKIYKTVDEFMKKYPPPEHTYTIQPSTQIQEPNITDMKSVKKEADANDSCHAPNFIISSTAQI
jgi:hypothetical protein